MRLPPDDPRRALPKPEWPVSHRDAFETATRQAGPLDEPGALAHLAPLTIDRYASAWGHWLAYRRLQDPMPPDEPLAVCLTPERVADFIRRMQGRLAPQTVQHRVVGLYLVGRAIMPEQDLGWLKRMVAVVSYRALPTRNKAAMLRPAHELVEAGIMLMDQAEAWIGGEPRRRAAHHRNGLALALLALRPLRSRNFSTLELDRHLLRDGDGWRIVVDAGETKAGNRIELPFPAALVPYLERHLERWRPVLLKGKASSRLWISAHGRALNAHKLYILVGRITEKLFGQRMTLHIFRDCAATHVAIHDPEHMGVATALLGHRSMATTQRHYNLARSREAASLMQQAVLELRRRAGAGRRRD
jgi:integrase